jgi:hypothetical protein
VSDYDELMKLRKLKRLKELEEIEKKSAPTYQSESEIPDYRELGLPFAPRPEQPDPTFLDKIEGVVDAGKTIASSIPAGMIAYPAGVIEGMADEIQQGTMFQPGSGQRVEQSAVDKMNLGVMQPQTEVGQDIVETIGEVTAPLVGVAPQMQQLQAMQAPNAARILSPKNPPSKLKLTPKLENELIERGIAFENLTPETKQQLATLQGKTLLPFQEKQIVDKAIMLELKNGGSDGGLAKYRLVNDRVQGDKLAQKAMANGFEEGIVQMAKTSDKASKKKMLDVLRTHIAIKSNERVAQTKRTADVAGRSLYDRVKYVIKSNNSNRTALDNFAKSKLKGEPFDVVPVRKAINDIFMELDIDDANPGGIPKPVFKGSLISGDKGSQRGINEMIRILSEAKRTDALGAHLMKRQLDTLIDFRKKAQKPLGKAGRDALMKVRSVLNEELRNRFDEYGQINDKLSAGLQSLDSLQDALPRSVDIYQTGSASALGQEIRKLFGNTQKRSALEASFNKIDDTASMLGGKFDDSYKDIYQFTRGIEGVFGKTLRNSFGGEIEDIASTFTTQGTSAAGAQAAGNFVRKVFTKEDKQRQIDAYIAMRDLLERD